VAEGVETEAQRTFLLEQGCELLQGFLLARPMPVDEVEALMSAEAAAA
jgi:EAL domain-containing protein (putative c-di-GMP-specific phosphodiesterase class I)